MQLDDLLGILERDGLLLLSDSALPSVVALIAGGPIGGSWWGHPRGNEIHNLSNMLADHADVLVVKLVSGKVTFVHRRLWPAVIAVGQSREEWQIQGLPDECASLLRLVDDAGELAWDDVPQLISPARSARTLETRLLIHTAEVHTPTGAHAKNLETWSSWSSRVGAAGALPDPDQARLQLEATLDTLSEPDVAHLRLPWHTVKPSSPGRGGLHVPRKGRKKARTSSASSSGTSRAAK